MTELESMEQVANLRAGRPAGLVMVLKTPRIVGRSPAR